MKATLKIRKLLNGKYMVIIDNGYGNELILTDQMPLEDAKNEVMYFYDKAEFVIES